MIAVLDKMALYLEKNLEKCKRTLYVVNDFLTLRKLHSCNLAKKVDGTMPSNNLVFVELTILIQMSE